MILILLNKIIKTSRDKKIAQQIFTFVRVIIVMVQFQSIIEFDYSAFMRRKLKKKKLLFIPK